jgi:hypothetical protein
MAPSRVGPRLRISENLKAVWAVCQMRWRSFSYLATELELVALVIPIVMGERVGGAGRGAITSTSVTPGEAERFKGRLSRWVSVSDRMSVSSPVGAIVVALLVVLAASSKVLDTQFPWGVVVVEFWIAFQQGPGIN